MDDPNIESLQRKTIDLLNLFFFQNDFKYRFRPDVFNFMINTRDKSAAYSPKSVKYFKKILKTKCNDSRAKFKIKSSINKDMLNDLKKIKRIQDEQNVYDALQEATVLDKISALKKKGIWTRDCLPKVVEPHRIICHGDFLLHEMEYMSHIFKSRLQWKIQAAKMLAECAKEHVMALNEIENLECIQIQRQGRLHCSIIARMIKDWWLSKDESKSIQRTNPYTEMKLDIGNNVIDYCQLWLTNSLINAEYDDRNYEMFSNKTDSESLCSFGSDIQSIMLKSCDEDDLDYHEDPLIYSELIDELKWLEYDSNTTSNLEIEDSIKNEIDELNALSQMPLEDIIDESYFINENNLNDSWSSQPESMEDESQYSQSQYDDNGNKSIVANQRIPRNEIMVNCEQLKLLLPLLSTGTMCHSDSLSSVHCDLERYLNNYFVAQNIQLLCALVHNNVKFSLVSTFQCGDDRFFTTILLGYLSQITVQNSPTLLITTVGMVFEWCRLFSTICPKLNIIILDSYIIEHRLEHAMTKINTSKDIICISTYSACTIFPLSDVTWNIVIYDQFDKFCECSISDVDISCFENISCERKVTLISQQNSILNDMKSLSLFFKILYTSKHYQNLLCILRARYSIKSKRSKLITDKLRKIAFKHVVPLMEVCNFEDSYSIIMCELTPIQQTLHDFVVNKLKRSLDSSSLLDFIEVVSQDIQVSQHPSLFDHSCGESDEAIYNITAKVSVIPSINLSLTYSSFDTIEYYIPNLVSSMLSDSWSNHNNYLSNDLILPLNVRKMPKDNLNKLERERLADLLISSSNIDAILTKSSTILIDNGDSTNITNRHSVKIENFFNATENQAFLSSDDIKRIKLEEMYWPTLISDGSTVARNCNAHNLHNGHSNIEKDPCSILTFHNSKIKSKLELAYLCKDNEIFSETLKLEDCCYPSISGSIAVDFNINPKNLNVLETLKSITRSCIDRLITNCTIIERKLAVKPPKLLSKNGKITPFINQNMLLSITTFYRNYFARMPCVKSYFYRNQEQLLTSGKLRTLNHMFHAMVNDSSTRKYIVVSHSFLFLNMIETLLHVNNNYYGFTRLRLNSSLHDNEKESYSKIEYFNLCHKKKKKMILLIHSKCDSFILDQIDASSSSIILTDSHWQSESDSLIKRLISRWHLNCIISGSSITSIYRLCSFGSLEQFFLTNNLSFIFDNTYINKNSGNSTSGAIICQQSLLKNFVDKLPSPLKEELISGFYVDDFQSLLQANDDFLKLSNESVCEIFNSFENAYDLAHNYHYQALKKLENYELSHSKEVINNGYFNFPKPLYFLKDNCDYDELKGANTTHRNWELCRIQSLKKLKHLQNLMEYHESLPISDSQNLDSFIDLSSWTPWKDNMRLIPHEISMLYESDPIPDTDLSLHLLPTKLYYTKDPSKMPVEKVIVPLKTPEEQLNVNLGYNDTERIKKRKYSSDSYQLGEINQFNKKRRILNNRRYFVDHDLGLPSNRVHIKERMRLDKKSSSEREVTPFESKDSIEIVIKKQPLEDVEHNLAEIGDATIYQSTIPLVPCSQNNIIAPVSDGNKFNSVVITAISGSIKVNLQRPFYSREGWKTLKSKRQHLSSGSVSNLNTKSIAPPSTSYLGQQRLLYNRGQFSLNAKFGSQPDVASQSNSENEYDKLPEWSLHEEAVLYQHITQHQDYQFSSNVSDKSPFAPNFKLCEYYMNFFAITNNHRSNEMCKIHFNKLQAGYTNPNSVNNNLSRNNKNQILSNPVISGVAGRKLKIKMKNSIGTYGTSNSGSSQPSTNKIKMFQYFINDMKVNLVQTHQIVDSSLNTFDNMTSVTSKMLDEVVNKSRLPSLLTNHSQTIKKNATHMNALEEHSIHPDKIFTPAMLIQRREDLDKERESETVHNTSNINRQQIILPVSTNYRSPAYFEGTQLNNSNHPLNHIRRSASANIGNSQNIYSIQAPIGNQVRTRYNLPINRQAMSVILKRSNSVMSGATMLHQSGAVQTSSAISGLAAGNYSTSGSSLAQNQGASIGSRNQIPHFQIQQQQRNNAVSTTTSRRPNTGQVGQVMPKNAYNFQMVRQNPSVSRQSSGSLFARPMVSTVTVPDHRSAHRPISGLQVLGSQASSGGGGCSNSIITVFPSATGDQAPLTMAVNSGRLQTGDRSIGPQTVRGQSIRTGMPSVAAVSRGTIMGQMPRMMSVTGNSRPNATNPNNSNNMGTGPGRNQD